MAYELPQPDLPEQLFIKFSRNFDNELWDRARFMMISEANFAVLSRSPQFPVAVPACLFADVESESGTGLIISECITYGRNGVEALYPKCMDFTVPEPLQHYKAILKGLAKLSGTHRGGRLSPDFGNIDALESYQDACFRQHENARIQLQMMTKMLNVWQTRKLGDVLRKLQGHS